MDILNLTLCLTVSYGMLIVMSVFDTPILLLLYRSLHKILSMYRQTTHENLLLSVHRPSLKQVPWPCHLGSKKSRRPK